MRNNLPVEILDYMLCDEDLCISDIIHFSQTNHYYREVVTSSSRIWRKIYFKTWPQFSELLDKNDFSYNWYEEVQYIHNLKQRTRDIISLMTSRLHNKQEYADSDFTEWLELYEEKLQTYYYLVDDLMSIVNTHIPINSIGVVPINTPGNKTLQYYARAALRFLRKLHLTKEWQSTPQKQQTFEKCVALILQWYAPTEDLSWKKFAMKLDKIADEVKEYLKQVLPNHPLFAVPEERLKMWRDANIKGNKYERIHCDQIINILTDFFHHHWLCIDYALKEYLGIGRLLQRNSIVFKIVCESIVRRLGLKCQPMIDQGGNFFMRFSQEYNVGDNDSCETDMNDQDNSLANDLSLPATRSVIKRLILNSSLRCMPWKLYDLCKLLFGELTDFTLLLRLAEEYMYAKLDCTWLIESLIEKIGQSSNRQQLESIIQKLKQYQAERSCDVYLPKELAKVRPQNLKYAIGMVMNYESPSLKKNIVCVICDWEPLHLAPNGQPLYRVLLESELYEDAPQDQLKPFACETDVLNSLDEIGKHFSHMFKTNFVPNAVKEKQYPYDAAVRHAYHQEELSAERDL